MANTTVLQVGVKLLIKNKDNQYLLVRRSREKYPEVEGRWDIVGGRINPGTTLLENLRREIKEETSLELIGTPKLIRAQDIIPNPERHIVRLTYVGEAEGEIKLDITENDAYKWYDRKELENLEDVNIYFKELINGNVF